MYMFKHSNLKESLTNIVMYFINLINKKLILCPKSSYRSIKWLGVFHNKWVQTLSVYIWHGDHFVPHQGPTHAPRLRFLLSLLCLSCLPWTWGLFPLPQGLWGHLVRLDWAEVRGSCAFPATGKSTTVNETFWLREIHVITNYYK